MKKNIKKTIVAVVLTLVLALGTAVAFTACGGNNANDPIFDLIEERLQALEREAAEQQRVFELMLLERDIIAAENLLEARRAHTALFESQLVLAELALTNAQAELTRLQAVLADLVDADVDDVYLVPVQEAIVEAQAVVDNAQTQVTSLEIQVTQAQEAEAEAEAELADLEQGFIDAPYQLQAEMMFNMFNRRIRRVDDYVLVPNRFFAGQVAGRPTMPRPDSVAPTRVISVPFDPQAVAVMCSSHLDILITLGMQDRVVAFTHMNQPAFIDYYFPRTGANILPDIHGVTPAEPHSPNFDVLDSLDNLDLVIFSSRARDRDTRFGRDYFGRLNYMAATIDLGSRTGSDDFILDVIENLVTLSAIFGIEDAGRVEVTNLLRQMSRVNTLATELEATALIVQFSGAQTMALFGGASRYSFVFNELGIGQAATPGGASQVISNVTYQHGTPAGAELLVGVNPDIIFVVDRYALNAHRRYEDGTMMATPINVLDHALFAGMYAIANNHVHHLDPVNWYMVLCGFRSLMYQFEEVYNALRQLATSRA